MYNKKYCLEKIEEFDKHNPIYDDVEGKTCYLAYFNVGERGWFLLEDDSWFSKVHRMHTSVVKDVMYTRGNQVIVITQNTKFTFTLINEN